MFKFMTADMVGAAGWDSFKTRTVLMIARMASMNVSNLLVFMIKYIVGII